MAEEIKTIKVELEAKENGEFLVRTNVDVHTTFNMLGSAQRTVFEQLLEQVEDTEAHEELLEEQEEE